MVLRSRWIGLVRPVPPPYRAVFVNPDTRIAAEGELDRCPGLRDDEAAPLERWARDELIVR